MRLQFNIYKKNALKLAPLLIGKLLCRNIDKKTLKLRITETECYLGTEDTACHAHKGKTERNKVMFEKGGKAYIYLCYGMHNMLNIVSGEENSPEAVLIRGGIIEDNENILKIDGPGKLTKALRIDRSLNSENLIDSSKMRIEDDGFKCEYFSLKRVGIEYATEEYKNKLWRFRAKNF